jgi:hypothetical protein
MPHGPIVPTAKKQTATIVMCPTIMSSANTSSKLRMAFVMQLFLPFALNLRLSLLKMQEGKLFTGIA